MNSKELQDKLEEIYFHHFRKEIDCTGRYDECKTKLCYCYSNAKRSAKLFTPIVKEILSDELRKHGVKPPPGTIIEEIMPDGNKAWTCY